MKLSIILLVATILQVSAKSYAQKITLSEKEAPLEKVLKEIREQSGYDFFYNSKLIKEANPVSINVRNMELEEVLKMAFSGQPFIYTINDKTIIIRSKPTPAPVKPPVQAAPVIKVSGIVTDVKGEPLPGASVHIKGTGKGIATDNNGRFTIDADVNNV
ncbi:MAG TPA: secretin and TonB N-terminal domain-containing protein, partial [Mucilaginibacter sp.]